MIIPSGEGECSSPQVRVMVHPLRWGWGWWFIPSGEGDGSSHQVRVMDGSSPQVRVMDGSSPQVRVMDGSSPQVRVIVHPLRWGWWFIPSDERWGWQFIPQSSGEGWRSERPHVRVNICPLGWGPWFIPSTQVRVKVHPLRWGWWFVPPPSCKGGRGAFAHMRVKVCPLRCAGEVCQNYQKNCIKWFDFLDSYLFQKGMPCYARLRLHWITSSSNLFFWLAIQEVYTGLCSSNTLISKVMKSKAWINIIHLCLVAFIERKMAHKKVRGFWNPKNCRRGDSTVLKAKLPVFQIISSGPRIVHVPLKVFLPLFNPKHLLTLKTLSGNYRYFPSGLSINWEIWRS